MKNCQHCGDPLANARKSYHDECKEPARLAAQASQRRCKRCKKVRAASSFSNDVTRVDGKFPWCKDCQTKYATGNAFQNPEDELNGHICPMDDTPIRGHKNRRFCSNTCKDRVGALRDRFNLSPEQFRTMVSAMNGHCPLCRNRVTVWHVDHNHRTRMVTGVVCAACNVGPLAYSYHSIEFVERLLDYLRNTPAQHLGIEAMVPEGANKPSMLHKTWRTPARKVLQDPLAEGGSVVL